VIRWTRDRVVEDASRFSSIGDWKKSSPNAYNAARRHGWHAEATSHMTPLHKNWTDDEIFHEAKKYRSRTEWVRNSPNSYDVAGRRGLRDAAAEHMGDKNPPKVWSKAKVLKEAKKHNTKRDWAEASRNSYNAAKYHGWFEEATAHMRALGSRHLRCIYKIEVKDTKLLYIGLTYNVERRFKEHLRSKRFSRLAYEYGLESIQITQLTDYVDRELSVELEKKYIREAIANGFELLNKNSGGVLGGSEEIIWTREAIIEDAKKFSTKSEWAEKSSGAFDAARRSGVYEEAVSHMPEYSHKWTKDRVLEEALKYKSLSEWRKHSGGSLTQARARGWFEEASMHMKKRRAWSDEAILLDAKRFTTRSGWKAANPAAYKAARDRGLLERATVHMISAKKADGSWTKTAVLQEALKYKNRTEWKRNSSGSYSTAVKKGWLIEASAHMPKRVNLSK